jgi:hypothetical protein
MHLMLRSLGRVVEFGFEFQRRQRVAAIAGELSGREHMAVRGVGGPAFAAAPINGNYTQLPTTVS